MNSVLLSLVVLCVVGYGYASPDADNDVWRARLACRKHLTHEDFFVLVKPRGTGRCSDLCSSVGATAKAALAVYPLQDFLVYPSVNSLHANVCCCRS